jgi:anion-transporting  ArsA/GET3 family ATPase
LEEAVQQDKVMVVVTEQLGHLLDTQQVAEAALVQQVATRFQVQMLDLVALVCKVQLQVLQHFMQAVERVDGLLKMEQTLDQGLLAVQVLAVAGTDQLLLDQMV